MIEQQFDQEDISEAHLTRMQQNIGNLIATQTRQNFSVSIVNLGEWFEDLVESQKSKLRLHPARVRKLSWGDWQFIRVVILLLVVSYLAGFLVSGKTALIGYGIFWLSLGVLIGGIIGTKILVGVITGIIFGILVGLICGTFQKNFNWFSCVVWYVGGAAILLLVGVMVGMVTGIVAGVISWWTSYLVRVSIASFLSFLVPCGLSVGVAYLLGSILLIFVTIFASLVVVGIVEFLCDKLNNKLKKFYTKIQTKIILMGTVCLGFILAHSILIWFPIKPFIALPF